MLRSALLVGAVETLAYSSWALWSMYQARQGSGVWIPLIPIFWLLLATRLWVNVRIAVFLADCAGVTRERDFLGIGMVTGALLSLAVAVFFGVKDLRYAGAFIIVTVVSAHAFSLLLSRGAWRRGMTAKLEQAKGS